MRSTLANFAPAYVIPKPGFETLAHENRAHLETARNKLTALAYGATGLGLVVIGGPATSTMLAGSLILGSAFIKSVDTATTCLLPMTAAKAARTNLSRITAAALLPGTALLGRIARPRDFKAQP